jgi:hypothetical protein
MASQSDSNWTRIPLLLAALAAFRLLFPASSSLASVELEGGATTLGPRDCARVVPLAGNFDRDTPPFFFPSPDVCALKAYNHSEGRACLSGRKVYVLGNSIARGFQFELLAMYGDAEAGAVSRTEQKIFCQSAWEANGQPCTLQLSADSPVRYWDMHLFMADDALDIRDPCRLGYASTLDCLEFVLADSAPGDILVFYLGGSYAKYRYDLKRSELNSSEAWEEWLELSAQHFKGALNEAWKGEARDVFHVRLAHIQQWFAHWNPTQAMLDNQKVFMDTIPLVNRVLDRAFEDAPWSVVDQWGINEGRDEEYTDEVHFQGLLSRVFWHVVLSSVCGSTDS